MKSNPVETDHICIYCWDGGILELRVQLDQKIYTKCLCSGGSLTKIAKESFAAGYKRAKEDTNLS